eukprot:g31323.t1
MKLQIVLEYKSAAVAGPQCLMDASLELLDLFEACPILHGDSATQYDGKYLQVNVADSHSNSLPPMYHSATTSVASVWLVRQDISRDGDGGHFREQLRVNHVGVGLESHVGQT